MFSSLLWWGDLFRCKIDLLNFSMGFNIIALYMEFLELTSWTFQFSHETRHIAECLLKLVILLNVFCCCANMVFIRLLAHYYCSCASVAVLPLLTWVESVVIVVLSSSAPVPAWLSSHPLNPLSCLHIVPYVAIGCQGYCFVFPYKWLIKVNQWLIKVGQWLNGVNVVNRIWCLSILIICQD